MPGELRYDESNPHPAVRQLCRMTHQPEGECGAVEAKVKVTIGRDKFRAVAKASNRPGRFAAVEGG